MYLRGEVKASEIENALRLPRNLLIDQKSVYVVRDSMLQLEEVQVVKITTEAAIVRGIPQNTPLLAQPVPGAYDGMKVTISKKSSAAKGNSTGESEAVGSIK